MTESSDAPGGTPAGALPDSRGLDPQEAARRLARDGPNELTPPPRRTPLRIAGEVAREPMLQLLVAAGAVYLVLGDLGEALLLLFFVLVTIAITIVQEHRTERVLQALRELTSPRALVRRGGTALRIPGREVVRGDWIVLEEGDRVPADAVLHEARDLLTDESLLTGESVPVAKQALDAAAEAPPPARPGGDGLPQVYAGCLVTRGSGLAEVVATGVHTEIGRIGRSLAQIQSPPTPLVVQTRRLVRVLATAGVALSVAVVLLWGLARGDWLAGVLAGITLAMSMLPEEYPLILSVYMAMGAWRLSRQRVLARRAATIEALGAATVLCSDKTGTLTRNHMAVAALVRPDGRTWLRGTQGEPAPLEPACFELLEAAVLASETQAFDPMEQALHELARATLPADRLHPQWQLVHEYGLSPQLLAMTHVWQTDADAAGPDGSGPAVFVATKGAAEAVAGLCRLQPQATQELAGSVQALAAQGLRVLGVARARLAPPAAWPASPAGFDFEFLGLVALADPLRPGVPEAVRECRQAGLRVIMITGDHPATAQAIAAQAGLETAAPPLTGAELATLDEAGLRERLATTHVCARVRPEQKLRIVQALRAQGQVVAMTGDGVNDAPALKAAHIGIAMGARGTDVAREASALVLLDDDFNAIVHAIRLGRRIYDNLLKAMAFVLAVHVPIAGLALLPLLLGWPLVFTPVHIAFLELLIDPACSIGFEAEPEERNVMNRPPRDPATPLFSRRLLVWSLLQGALVLLACTALLASLVHAGVDPAATRAAVFLALVLGSVSLILANRAISGTLWQALRASNPVLWRMVGVALALLAATLLVAPVRELFGFAPLTPALAGAGLATGGAIFAGLALMRRLRPR